MWQPWEDMLASYIYIEFDAAESSVEAICVYREEGSRKERRNVGGAWGELRSFENRGARAPGPQKGGAKIFKILNFENEEIFSKLLSASVDIGTFIAYFGGKKCIRVQHEVYNEDADAELTPTGPGEHMMMISCLLSFYWLLYRDFWLVIITLVVIGRKNIAFRSLLHVE